MASTVKDIEKYLLEEKTSNEEKKILPSNNKIIDRYLKRSSHMRYVYNELLQKLPDEVDWRWIMVKMIEVPAEWSPEKNKQVRDRQHQLVDINRKIAKKARDLSNLLLARTQLSNAYALHSSDDYEITQWVERAAELSQEDHKSYLFKKYLKPEFTKLKSFDLKYWPSLDELTLAIAVFAEEANVQAYDELTLAALSKRQNANTTLVRAFLQSMQNLPFDFSYSDESISITLNCALDLDPENQQEISPEAIREIRCK